MALEDILRDLGCKHPFRTKPIVYDDGDSKRLDFLTTSGWKAYDRLITLLYSIDSLCPDCININDLVDELDKLVSTEQY